MAERRNFYGPGFKGDLDEKGYLEAILDEDDWYCLPETISEARHLNPGLPIIKYTITAEVVYG